MSPSDPSEIEDTGWQMWVSDLGYWRVDMRHIVGARVSNNEWIRKCQYCELCWALKQINPTAI
jgi:hypothetical protein